MKPLVSILIPCYDAEPWLAETLESALAQTWPHTEIILVDDGSRDRSLEIARSYGDRGVRVIAQANRGASAARNCALQAARGDFIQYLDADDLLAPEKIERQLARLGDANGEYVAAGEWARFIRSPAEAQFVPEPLWQDLSPVEWFLLAWGENEWMMHPAAWLVPRAIADRAGLWNEAISLDDDGEYFSRVILASQGIQFSWGARSYYRSGRAGSLSRRQSDAAWESQWLAIELGCDRLLRAEESPRTRRICAIRYQRFIYLVFPDVPTLRDRAEQRVSALGGCDLQPQGGPAFQMMSAIAGWQRAKSLQRWVYRYGYRRAALGWRLRRWWQRR